MRYPKKPQSLTAIIGIIAGTVVAFAAPDSLRQPQTLTVTVVDSLSRRPLPNADVGDLVSGQRRITDEQGRAYLNWSKAGTMQLRVRQVGYTPRRASFAVGEVGGAVTLAMTRVAYVIHAVRATGRCATQPDTTALDVSVVALDQLQQAAQKYDEFRRAYPFEAFVERRTVAVPPNNAFKRAIVAKEKYRSEDWNAEYRPGDIVKWQSGQFKVPLLLLPNLGDSVFWEHHCFAARGFHWYQGARVVRLEFSPTADVDGPDYEGTATLDSSTSMLLRVDFHLANARRGDGPTRLEGYTTFISPSPFVMVPDSTLAMWWRRNPEKNDWGNPDYAQSLHVDSLKYLRQTPPASWR
jgi:hypothetical protein